jgi:hypothetical protein
MASPSLESVARVAAMLGTAGLWRGQLRKDAVAIFQMKRLRMPHRREDRVGIGRIVTIAIQSRYQGFLLGKVSFAQRNVALSQR